MQTVLVTGATGFIGQAVVRLLLQEGYRVRALVCPSRIWPFPFHPALQRVDGDMRDRASLQVAADKVDWIAHLAAAKSDERDSWEVNVEGAKHLIDTAREAGVAFLINVSTQSAKLSCRGVYGNTKSEADALLQTSGVPTTTLRVSVVHGDVPAGIIGSIIRSSRLPFIPVFGDGTARFSPIHRDDLAHIVLLAAKRPETRGKTYDVGGPEPLSFNELIRAVVAKQGKRRPLLRFPVAIGLWLARMLSFLHHPPFTESNVLGGAEDVPMDLQMAFREFGYVPRPFSQSIEGLFSSLPLADREADALLRYVLGGQWDPGPEHRERFRSALRSQGFDPAPHLDDLFVRSPFLLSMLDTVTRVRFPASDLQRKLLVAAAVAECQPASATHLLPRRRSFAGLFFSAALTLLAAAPRLLGAGLLAGFFPRLVCRNAGR